MLNGENVTLRALTREDMPALWRWSSDVEYVLLIGDDPPHPRTLQSWHEWYDDEIASSRRVGKQVFAIDHEDMLIGTCGLYNVDPFNQACELGITIGERDCWNKGYGREAIGLLLDYAFRLRGLRRIWLGTLGNNERALRCYRACGFQEEGRLRAHLWSNGEYVDSIIMGLLKSEWDRRA